MKYRVVWTEDHVAYVDIGDRELGCDLNAKDIFNLATDDHDSLVDLQMITVKEYHSK